MLRKCSVVVARFRSVGALIGHEGSHEHQYETEIAQIALLIDNERSQEEMVDEEGHEQYSELPPHLQQLEPGEVALGGGTAVLDVETQGRPYEQRCP